MGFREAWSKRPNRGLIIQVASMTVLFVGSIVTLLLPRHAYLVAAALVLALVVFWTFLIVGVRRDWFIRKD